MYTVLAIGFHDQEAPRHTNICKKLLSEGKKIIECHTQKKGYFAKLKDLRQQFLRHKDEADALMVTFPGHYLVPAIRLWTRKPIIFDAFISLHDTNVFDRQKVSPWSPRAWWLYCIDWLACHLANDVLIDTEAHRQYFISHFRLNPKKITVVYLGTRDDFFNTRNAQRATRNDKKEFSILFYGTYIPLQGIEHIIDAAEILKDRPDIQFTLIGTGQTFASIKAMANRKQLRNIKFQSRVPYTLLPDLIAKADLCLGIFGTTNKTMRVIPHKVYDAVACGTPVLTADTPAIAERFADEPLVHLCKAGDGRVIADAIEDILLKDPPYSLLPTPDSQTP
ncbi:MAG: glycosyltransferase [bacterium]|nr:glycosyltransferase [bacterium]